MTSGVHPCPSLLKKKLAKRLQAPHVPSAKLHGDLKNTYKIKLHDEHETPAWLDSVLSKAVHINPYKRYASLSEFVYDLRHPNTEFLSQTRPPLAERHPVLFWKGVSAVLAVMVLVLVFARFGVKTH